MKAGAAIIGSGNIGTDLMIKITRLSERIDLAVMVGIDPESDGLARARRLGVATTHEGLDGLLAMPEFADVRIVFDATSAGAHLRHARELEARGRLVVDLTPAAVGPYVVPGVPDAQIAEGVTNINMVTCGGQATVPIAAAVSRVADVAYAEIVASIASKSAGPGTRANIDEFTETTSEALRLVGGAEQSKAIIILNPAEPPMVMRDTVYCLATAPGGGPVDREAVTHSIEQTVAHVAGYVPGYVLKQEVQFDEVDEAFVPALGRAFAGTKVSVFLQVTGAAHYLPEYAGNLDIMTSAALRAAEALVERASAGKEETHD
ncbi:acetaldehyde dehydrogenase (acetylating) [Leucobacter triazinivorans]|uniref:Acetaldehyde dehydrogenase n=1 Tax=Leucobacter triazinivorans TaxID=1784719 RepID=A0A4P6KCA5_9MICO|nr:acetaldehyde dehydrogenase (acetylating) [Leucobacter triazinivorans]QBE47965.1 acetaldehyde dehydrogenase (acetylating) [Leucobacter triazinivorans]